MVDIGDIRDTALDAAGDVHEAVMDKLTEGWDPYPEPGGKRGQMRLACQEPIPEDANYINRLIKDLGTTFDWSGNFCMDYAFYVLNWHPLLGLFFCHPNHPWTKKERLGMLIISIAITIVPAALIARSVRKGHIEVVGTPIIIACITIPDAIASIILYQLSVIHIHCPVLEPCVRWLKYLGFCIVMLFAVIAAVLCFFILTGSRARLLNALIPLARGKAWTYATWFPFTFFMPCCGFLWVWCFSSKDSKDSEFQPLPEATESGNE